LRIRIRGAAEHNLKNVDVEIGDGLTVVTGVSGSGKTSLVFDTVYHEARRRFQEAFAFGSPSQRLPPARVESITGLGPAVAVGQNLLNRNPNSTMATASGLHPFLRLLYAKFGARSCPVCGEPVQVLSGDEIIERTQTLNRGQLVEVYAPLLSGAQGSHGTLLSLLEREFGAESVIVDGEPWSGGHLDSAEPHNVEVKVAELEGGSPRSRIRDAVEAAKALGADTVRLRAGDDGFTMSGSPVCTRCGTWLRDLRPQHFNRGCPHCGGEGCERCGGTGLSPEASSVIYAGLRLPGLLSLSADEAFQLFEGSPVPESAYRLGEEITKRLVALRKVGLGYVSLDRPSPSLSRGESQRVRLAVALTSRLEDVLHVLDEPTIGQHPRDVSRLLPAFRELGGPVLYVEHDRVAAAEADSAVDLGPGAGVEGGMITFTGTPGRLWESDTVTGRYFSLRSRVEAPGRRLPAEHFITLKGATAHNLKDITVKVPVGRLTVVTGVSGSGKSTLVEDVMAASLNDKAPVGCVEVEGPRLRPVMVDQSPIGRNPRSTPATYTKLSDLVRDHYASETGLSASHFSFNRPEGACPTCQGMGAVEVKMRYLPSTWITCADCEGRRYRDEVLDARIRLDDRKLSVADFYELSVAEAYSLLIRSEMEHKRRKPALRILRALMDIGLGYLGLGQPSPTLSGGEAQRVKLARYLGRGRLGDKVMVLDEPSTGLHPADIDGLLVVLDRLVRGGATVVVVEHNTDIIRAADWVIDLGPGAGPEGGEVVYMGEYEGLLRSKESVTAFALRDEIQLEPRWEPSAASTPSTHIRVRGARANNLRDVDVDIPKAALTVVTGVSGSGKSSLVRDVLEAEARRRYLETLSLYERQGTREGPEAPVESVTGLGVTLTVTPDRRLYNRRSTVGTATEISHHLEALLSVLGGRTCTECGAEMDRGQTWVCPACGAEAPIAPPRRFNPATYAAACTTCNGVGSLIKPVPEKLIVGPAKPLCGGAMYSPGFFPQGYLCKPGNGGYDVVQAFAARHGFDPASTPWSRVPEDVRNMFYHGDPEPLEVTFRSPRGRTHTRTLVFNGFYGWLRDWDVGGTYTDTVTCPACGGARLRPEYLAVTLGGYNIHELSEMPLKALQEAMIGLTVPEGHPARRNHETIMRRLGFLIQVGLGYIHLNRVSASLSAGEAQRVKLAGLLGSGITSLTVLMDEPSRGLHPGEVDALLDALTELRDEGNTVVVVEHDPGLILGADHIVDMGPGPGTRGGCIVAMGSPSEVSESDTVTGAWLRGERKPTIRRRRKPKRWMTVRGARENNLKGDDVRLPVGVLVGVCGVSGSGKSTLMIDTLGRALSPVRQTTSVAYEPMQPGIHDEITGAPRRALLVDQSKKGVRSPLRFLKLRRRLTRLYAESEDAKAMGITEKKLGQRCSVCNGSGHRRIEMEFLPDIHEECETCRGTGYAPEAWDVRLRGYSLPELNGLTLAQLHDLFGDEPALAEPLKAAMDVGLGYLVLDQPGHTLSGGEAQRLKIAAELCKKTRGGFLYILDEPTVGQHMDDVDRLTGVLHRLVDEGNTVAVVEHSPHLLTQCDHLIELGPEGGPGGGRVIAEGTPEELASMDTPTSAYLRKTLEGEP
jgi:excinuclease ABC subunit A